MWHKLILFFLSKLNVVSNFLIIPICAQEKKVSTKNLLNKYEFRKKTLFSASDMLRYEGSNTLRDNYWGQKFDEFNKWSISRSICQMLFITAAYVSIDSLVKPRKKYEKLFQKFFFLHWIFFEFFLKSW